MNIQGFAFAPQTVTIQVGGSVTWTNMDRVAHTATDDGHQWGQTLSPGQTYTHVFTAVGTFAYSCAFHSSMHGTIQVVAPGTAAVPALEHRIQRHFDWLVGDTPDGVRCCGCEAGCC